MTKQNAVLSVDFTKIYSTAEDGVIDTAKVCISKEAIQSGIIADIGANRLAILLAIVSYMDENGQAFPSQEKIAELTGQGRATVQRNIKYLLEAEFNGQKLLSRELQGGTKKKSIYTITHGEVTGTDLTDETAKKAEKPKQMKSKDYVLYFAEKFRQQYGHDITIDWRKDTSLMKKVVDNYGNEEEVIKALIDICFREYKNKWYKPQYPTPSIFTFYKFIADACHNIYKVELEQSMKQQERKQKAVEQDDTDRALDLFDI